MSAISVALVGFALFGIIYFITLYMQNIRGYSALESGVRTLPMTLIVMAVAPIAGQPLDSHRAASADGGRHADHVARPGLAHATHDRFQLLDGDLPLVPVRRSGRRDDPADDDGRRHGLDRSGSAGIASGVINSSRQVGGALGVAVLGSIAATIASANWSDNAPAAVQGTAARFEPLVVGGQASTIARAAGPDAGLAASHAFIDGVTTAMTVGSLLALTGAIVAFIGLRGFRPIAAPQSVPVAVEA